MVRRYCAFLVRCWRLDDGERRIEIAHIQSGARTRATSVAAALAWIGARAAENEGGHPFPHDPEGPAASEEGDAVGDDT